MEPFTVMQPRIPGNGNLNIEVKRFILFWFFSFYKGKGIKRRFEGSKMLLAFVCTRVYSPVIGKDKNWPERKFDESLQKSFEIRTYGVLSSIPHPLSRSDIYEKNQL